MKSGANSRAKGRFRLGRLSAVFLVMALAGAVVFVGCATTPSDRESDLPWNVPQSWEGAPMIPGFSSGGM
jgi:hypothetical protein